VSEIRVRRATPDDAAAIAEVQVASWRTTYRGMIADDYLDRLSVATRTQRWGEILRNTPRIAFVAEREDGTAVGFADGGPNRTTNPPFDAFSAELDAIYLLAPHQRGGIGRRLVGAIAGALLELGHTSMLVWVLEKNPARGFYEALGGRFVGAAEIGIDGVKYPDVAYGWDDLCLLS
jgi:GNAT superfamily N-acetyltransferase